MAKIVKSNREVPDIDLEVAKVSNKKKKVEPKKTNKKGNSKKTVKNNKTSFVGEVKKEVSKVVWPSKKDLIKYSIAAITFIIFFAIFFYVIELIMALLKAGV